MTNLKLHGIWMLFIAIMLCVLSLNVAVAYEGTGRQVAKKIIGLKEKNVFTKSYDLFTQVPVSPSGGMDEVVKGSTLLSLGADVQQVVNTSPDYLRFTVPVDNGTRTLTVLLYKVTISQDVLNVIISSGSVPAPVKMVHYRGCISNDAGSVASMSFGEKETMGIISGDEGNFVIGKLQNRSGLYVIYNDRNLPQAPFDCGTTDDLSKNNSGIQKNTAEFTSAKCVNMYWETDYDLFTAKGSTANVTSYIQGVFNQVATLYANDGISVNLKTLFVWDTADPYTGTSTSNYLDQFGAYRTSFDGNIASLIGTKGGGGIAWVGTYCHNSAKYRMSYNGISTSYNSVPTYSWTVEVITHENGHLLGSNHTHSCAWNGNNSKIDDCGGSAGYSAGSCTPQPSPAVPVGGGTIMSYCHLTSAGIAFSKGFGPQPTALILNNVNNASCMAACSCPTPGQPASISGNTSVCPSTSNTYTAAVVPGATSYTWTLPSGWTGSSTTNSITITAGSAGGTLTVRANNSCGSGSSTSLAVTIAAPAQPGNITGITTVCGSTSQTYSIAAVAGAASYTWTLPSGWTGTSTTTAITATTGSSGGSITVRANNSCGSSVTRSLTVTVTGIPALAGSVSGNSIICAGSSQTYSVSAASGATGYTWTLPSGWIGSSTTNSIVTTAGSSGGTISARANNSCGSGNTISLLTAVNTITQPGAITGNASVCSGSSQTYSVTAVSGATGYIWTLPSGWTGSSSTNSITGTAGASGGTVSVQASFSCGTSTAQTLAVSSSSVVQPGTISGSNSVCAGTSATYSVTAVSGATSYSWILPSGWTGSSSTNSITATAGAAGGIVSVSTSNGCGTGASQSLTVSIGSIAQPGAISGSTSACAGLSQIYSVSPVAGATSYTWTLPSGWTGTSAVTSITTVAGSTGGTISVRANGSCGTSSATTLAVSIGSMAQPGAISGSTTVCGSSSQTYSVAAVAGATSYTWTLPSGWTGTSAVTSITTVAGSTGGTISVRANGSCGTSIARTLAVSIGASIAQPGVISGSTTVCGNSSQVYSVAAVSGATSYTWTLPSGWTGSSTINSITTIAGTAGGTISVKANNSCGTSAARTTAVSIISTIAQPGVISGSTTVCGNSSQVYSVAAVSGATSYTWTLPSGWTGSSTINSITTIAGTAGGTISVKANNSCGTSAARTLTVSITGSIAQPGAISGSTTVCGSSSQTYSVAAVAGATSYTWTLPSGWAGSSSSTSIISIAGTSGGTISVKANGSCGTSAARTLTVSVGTIAQPGAISGNTTVCGSSSQTYSVAAVAGATSYTWTLPSGWAGSSTGNTITATPGSAGGTISVKANSSCGSSASRTLTVSVGAMVQPGTMYGSNAVCAGSSQAYSISAVAGATSYTWTLPSGWSGASTGPVIFITSGGTGGTISVKANGSCGSSAARTLTVAVIPAPAQPGIITGNTTIAMQSQQTYSVTAVPGANNYTWVLPPGWTGISTTNTITVTTGLAGGVISVSANGSCGISVPRTLSVIVTSLSSSFEALPDSSETEVTAFTLYPNPSEGEITIAFPEELTGATVDIYNIAGQVIYSRHYEASSGGPSAKIDLSAAKPGIYMVKVSGAGNATMQKLIIQQ